jgi:hypothetical protein
MARLAASFNDRFMLLAVGIVLHSWVRWGIVFAILYVFWIALLGIRERRTWTEERDSRAARIWVGVTDGQFLIGMILYFGISPIAAIARADHAAAAASPAIRFFGFMHPIAMTAYVLAAHVTWVLVRRADSSPRRYRRLLIGALISALLLLCAIPWPVFEYGRPLFRP